MAAVLPTACKKSATEPSGPTVTNNSDDFTYQTPHLDAHTGTESYSWQNSGTSADVTQSSSIATGFATLTIWDGAALQVYQAALSTAGTFTTATGTAGTWTIRVDWAHASGTVGFRVKKH